MIFFLVALALIPPRPLAAQKWTAFTSMRRINDLLVHDNAVWGATSGGVLRFDRATRTYRRYTRLDGLAGNRVLSIALDERGHLWFGTEGQGLSRFRPEADAFDPPFLDFVDLRVQALLPYKDRLFVGTDEGISVFLIDKEEVKETYRQLGLLPKDTAITALAVDQDTLWAGTEQGMAWAALSQPNLQDPDSWNSLRGLGPVADVLIAGGTILSASDRGIFFFDPESGRFSIDLSPGELAARSLGLLAGVPVAASSAGDIFRRNGAGDWSRLEGPAFSGLRALSRRDTALWIGTGEGLKALGAPLPPPSREPAANAFFEMELLDEGELWVASAPNDQFPANGLYQFDGRNWTVHGVDRGLPTDILVALETDTRGLLWVGSWGQGVFVRDPLKVWRRLTPDNSILSGIPLDPNFVVVSDIVRDEKGLMWLSNVQAGLVVMDAFPPRRSFRYEQRLLALDENRDINKIALGPGGLKWLATPRDGFILFDDGGTPFEAGDEFALRLDQSAEERLTSNRVSDIVVDGEGQVWVGTDNGLNAVRGTYSRARRRFDIESWRVYTARDGLLSSEINDLEKDDEGNIWVATEGGLSQIGRDGEVAFTLTTANSGLIDNRTKSLLFDKEREALWIGTVDGLSRLDLSRRAEGGESKDKAETPRVYPNPFVANGFNELNFAGLPPGASLRIFSGEGALIRRLEGAPGGGTLSWNGQNQRGFLVSSGIYFYIAEDQRGRRLRGKFAVVSTR